METELQSDFRIPTATLQARVKCMDGQELEGRLFVPTSSSSRPGPMSPEERLNDAADFFPFAVDGRTTVFINKIQVVSVSFRLDAEQVSINPADIAPSSGHAQRVTVECPGFRVKGELLIDMPEYKRRVLDYLNRPERFLSLRSDGVLHLIHREHVLRVTELHEAQS